MTRLYISGPMSGYGPGHNFEAFNRAALLLETYGFDVENPADKGIINGWSWAQYMKYDIDVLLRCDGLAMLPNWECSRGARLEVHVALELGMPVLPVQVWADQYESPLADLHLGTVL